MPDFGGVLQSLQSLFENGMDDSEMESVGPIADAMGEIKTEAAAGKDARTQIYEAMRNRNSELSKQKIELLSQMGTEQPLSKPQVAAMMLIGILPTLVGGLAKGKKGLAAGAEAGKVGTLVMKQGFEQEQKKKDLSRAGEIEAINDQLTKNNDLLGKSDLDKANNQEKAVENQLDRENKIQTAEIRANGEAKGLTSISKELGNMAKTLQINKETADQNARTEPVKIGRRVFVDSGRVTEKRREKMDEVTSSYQSLIDNLKAMEEISNNAENGAISRSVGEVSEELDLRREMALEALTKIQQNDTGAGSSVFLKRLNSALVKPGSAWQNILAAVPVTASMEGRLDIARKVADEEVTRYYKSMGMNSFNIGQSIDKDGRKYYVVGVNPKTKNIILESDLNKVNSILSEEGLPLIGQ